MSDQVLRLRRFSGGLSDDSQYGPEGSYGQGQAIDSRRSPGYITLHRKLQKESAAVIDTEIHDGVRVEANHGDVYLAGGTKIYKRAPGANGAAGTYTVDSSDERLTNVQDLDYRPDLDLMFLIDNKTIHELSPIRNTPTYSFNKYREMVANVVTASPTAVSFTAAATNDTFTAPAHGLSNGDVILFSGTALPSPLTDTTRYFVINATAGTFQVSTTEGGSAVNLTGDGSGNFTREGYALPGVLVEAEYWSFVLEKEPIYSITFTVAYKGTGNWNLVLHDGSNHEIATIEVGNTLLPNAGFDVQFTFNEEVRAKLGATYHAHLVSSDGTGAVRSTNANTLQAAQGSIKANRLVDTGDFGHVAIQLGARSYICNEKYIAEWEPLDTTDNASAGYNPHKLVAPSEVVYIGACLYNEYTVFAGGLKRSTDTLVDELTEGILSFWNGTDEFITFNIPVPQGVPHSLFSVNNIIYFEARGTWYRWAGGDIEPVYQFPGVDEFLATEDGPQIEAYLKAGRHVMAANPDNTLSVGFPYTTANTNLQIGLYSWGKSKSFMPLAINSNGTISTGNDTVQFDESTDPHTPITGITLVKRFGTNLLIAWKDVIDGEVVYGVDYVNDTSPAASVGVFGTLWFDDGTPDKEKTPKALKAVFRDPLPAGCSVEPFVQYDRSATRQTEDTAVAGAREAVLQISTDNRFYDVLGGVILRSSEGNFPFVKSLSFKFDNNDGEDTDVEVVRDWPTEPAEE